MVGITSTYGSCYNGAMSSDTNAAGADPAPNRPSSTPRVVLITGGTRGIGRGIAERFCRHDDTVIVCGRSAPDEVPRWRDNSATFIAADVGDPASVDELFTTAETTVGPVEVLINNAGGSPPADAATVSPRFSEAIIRLNLLGPLHCAQRANATMQTLDSGGVIVNIASVSGERPSPGTAAYGAAKAGLLSLTRSLAVEWAPRVRVTAVTCGLIATELADMHYGDDAAQERVASTIPLGRLGTPDDVASACLFLSSPFASYVTGASLHVHGGGERPAFLDAAAADTAATGAGPVA